MKTRTAAMVLSATASLLASCAKESAPTERRQHPVASIADPWYDEATAIEGIALDSSPAIVRDRVVALLAAVPDAEVGDFVSLARSLAVLGQLESALILLDQAIRECPDWFEGRELLINEARELQYELHESIQRELAPESLERWRLIADPTADDT